MDLLHSPYFYIVSKVVLTALIKSKELPRFTHKAMLMLGHSLGRFDLDGQLADLEIVRQMCIRDLQGLSSNKGDCLKTYQILGFSAGAALIILLI